MPTETTRRREPGPAVRADRAVRDADHSYLPPGRHRTDVTIESFETDGCLDGDDLTIAYIGGASRQWAPEPDP